MFLQSKCVRLLDVVCLNICFKPFNSHISAMVGALFNLNNHCRTVFSHSDEKVIDLREEYCPVKPLKVNLIV